MSSEGPGPGAGPGAGQGWQPPPGPPPPPGQGWQPPPGQPPPAPPYGYGPPPPQYGYGPPQPQTEGTAITALVLSIASFMVCPVVLSGVALALIPSSKRKIQASGGALTGESLLNAARIVSWINIGLSAAVILFMIILFIIGAATEDEFSLALSLSEA